MIGDWLGGRDGWLFYGGEFIYLNGKITQILADFNDVPACTCNVFC